MKNARPQIARALFLSFFSLTSVWIYANKVKVENVRLTNQNTTTDVKDIEFDISWENSWRTSATPGNHDACWVFAKYRLTSGTAWNHATLSVTDGDHSAPTGSTIDAVADGKGIFIYRDADGSGNNDWDNVQLNWAYGVDGLADIDSVEIAVFAIEMVNIPEGGFDLGDGNGVTSGVNAFELVGTENTAVAITDGLSAMIETDASTSLDDILVAQTGFYLDGDGGIDLTGDGDFDDPDENGNFPVGYNEMYCMKYEISQGQFVDFVNKLTTTQANVLISAEAVARQNISGSGNSWGTTSPNRPRDLGAYDLMSYLDWAALRPMTETEFEKICRGTTSAVANEYAWGTTSIHATAYTLGLDGTEQEEITNMGTGTGNASHSLTDDTINGPLRCGIFAAGSANNTREETGGTFYGVMEMSGNLSEIVVFLGDADGRAFDGSNGDGEIFSTGYADQSGWPGYDGTDNNLADGAMTIRGGDYSNSAVFLRISNRSAISAHPTTSGVNLYGGRGVRNP